jgi:serine/threonine-protein kinase HipA
MQKKKNLRKGLLINYFGKERCELNDTIISRVLETISKAIPEWTELIKISFLSTEMKDKYQDLLNARLALLDL